MQIFAWRIILKTTKSCILTNLKYFSWVNWHYWIRVCLATSSPHLFIHKDIDDWVDDGARLGQDWRNDACFWCDQVRWPKGGQQSHDTIWQPAQQVTDHHDNHHEQNSLLPLSAHWHIDPTHLETIIVQRREEDK